MHILHIVIYWIAWLLFVAAQAQNSVKSKTNGLPSGWAGFQCWLEGHAVNLATRALFCAVACGFFIHYVAVKVESGWAATLLPTLSPRRRAIRRMLCFIKLFGYFPWLRVEVADLAPPPNAQIVPPSTSNGPNLNSGAKQP